MPPAASLKPRGAVDWRGILLAGSERTAQVQGMHRMTYPRSYFVLWCLLIGLSAVSAVLEGRWLSIPVATAIAGVVLLVNGIWWAPGTEVLPRGLRTKRGWRTKEFAWDDVRSVESPGRWELGGEVRIRLHDGSSVPLVGMRADRWAQELESYWRAHRNQAPDESGQA
jgi:hypothetical protein